MDQASSTGRASVAPIRFAGDMITRVIACRMDTGMENPGSRKFDRDLRVYVPQNRPRLVVAALTVLRAFVVAGRPGLEDLEPFARFEDWSNLVRGALVWLDEPDPLLTRDAVVAIDPERENLGAVLRAWARAIGYDRWMTAKEVIDLAEIPRRRLPPASLLIRSRPSIQMVASRAFFFARSLSSSRLSSVTASPRR